MQQSEELARVLLAELRRRMIEESGPRLLACLQRLDAEQLWQRPNPASNSAGHLILHLCGNLDQWILCALGGAEDRRVRASEFEPTARPSAAELRSRLERTLARVDGVLQELEPRQLLLRHVVQGFEESGVAVLVHATEHLSYHTGQVSYITKALTGRDLGYYAGVDLNRVGSSRMDSDEP